MARTESVVVQVSPDFENAKIEEMQHFGWSLSSRQEVIGHLREAATPDSLFAAVTQGAMDGATGTKRVEYDHFVKLHFSRDLDLPHLSEIRVLESEYQGLPYPAPAPLKWPVGLTLFFGLGIFIGGSPQDPVTSRLFFAALAALCAFWVYRRLEKRRQAKTTRVQSEQRGTEIASQLSHLVGLS